MLQVKLLQQLPKEVAIGELLRKGLRLCKEQAKMDEESLRERHLQV